MGYNLKFPLTLQWSIETEFTDLTANGRIH